MAKPVVRMQALQVVILAGLGAVVLRSAQVQLLQGGRYASEARANRTEHIVLPARRGALYDRSNRAIALTQESYHVGVAPNELRDPPRDAITIARALRLPLAAVRADLHKRWAYYGGPFVRLDIEPISEMGGVHLEPVLRRFNPLPGLARAVIGSIGADGHGASGLEHLFDSLLAGQPGAAVVLKDRGGHEYESPKRVISMPVSGADLVLTLDADLQEIAEGVLTEALHQFNAAGGDVVILDPHTGELLAVASKRRDGSTPPSAFTETYEPGSLAKIFAAASLLSLNRVGPNDYVSGEGGRYKLPGRPVLTDDEPLPRLTLAQAIAVSSNIAMAKFVTRLDRGEQYGMLRDFGFGAPTGVEFPSESPGRLRRPAEWSGTSPVSLAIGYELSATPLQIAAAYGAIANDGILLTPTLIREVRDPTGEVLYRHRPEPVRRVVTAELARQLRVLLRGVVEHGTARAVTIAHFGVAAKTGTARRTVKGRYAPDEYVASLATLFPADTPQVVVVVKIDNPDPRQKKYFASQTAAPVTRQLLEQALASRTMTLNRARMATTPIAAAPPADGDDDGSVPYVVPWPFHPDTSARSPLMQVVPDVQGQPLREAVRVLHRHGFRVALRGFGVGLRTAPRAGAAAPAGSVVTLFAAEP